MGLTKVEWADLSFNPWWGCEKVSPGCAHCYADTLSKRYANGVQLWGDGHEFRFFGDKHWAEPLKWARLLPAKLGRRPRVFCASMADVFEERDELVEPRARLFDLIRLTPQLDWLILTKRPEAARDELARLYDYLEYDILEPSDPLGYLPNVWMGVSIENSRFTCRADVLREIPAAVRFISAEPLLGSLFPKIESRPRPAVHPGSPSTASLEPGAAMPRAALDLTAIDWVIAGGESGRHARPSHPDWFRELRDACFTMTDVAFSSDHEPVVSRPAFFFKQWGEWAPGSTFDGSERDRVVTYDGRDRTWPQWIEDGYRAGAGHARPVVMHRAGKRNAGRELDGRTWDEFPQSAAVPA